MDNVWYIVTTADGTSVLRKSKRIRNAIGAVTHYEYMRQHAGAIYELWVAALKTKQNLRSIRWVDPKTVGVALVGNPTANSVTTYVERVALFLGQGNNDPIVERLLLSSLNAREKAALQTMRQAKAQV